MTNTKTNLVGVFSVLAILIFGVVLTNKVDLGDGVPLLVIREKHSGESIENVNVLKSSRVPAPQMSDEMRDRLFAR